MKKTASAQLLEGQQGIAFSCHCWLRWEKEDVSWDASLSHIQVKKGWGCLLKCSILYKHMIYLENGYHNKAETKSNFSNFHVVFTLPIIAKIMLSISKGETHSLLAYQTRLACFGYVQISFNQTFLADLAFENSSSILKKSDQNWNKTITCLKNRKRVKGEHTSLIIFVISVAFFMSGLFSTSVYL